MTDTTDRVDVAWQLARRALEYVKNHPCTEETGVPCPDEEDLREALDAFFVSRPP